MSDIRNCKFEYRCTQRWDDFEGVPGTMRVRFCTRCQSAVHRADSEVEFAELARQGKCVAVFQDDVPLELTAKPAVAEYVPKLRIVK